MNQAILRYTSVLISQPFDVAKTVLQCQYVPRKEECGGKVKGGKKGMEEERVFEDDLVSSMEVCGHVGKARADENS